MIASQQRLIETGLADATNLLVDMDPGWKAIARPHTVHGQTRPSAEASTSPA